MVRSVGAGLEPVTTHHNWAGLEPALHPKHFRNDGFYLLPEFSILVPTFCTSSPKPLHVLQPANKQIIAKHIPIFFI